MADNIPLGQWSASDAVDRLRVAIEIDEVARVVTPLRPADALDCVYSINIAFSASLEALATPNRPQ